MSGGERKKNNKQGIEDKLRQKEENGRSEMAHLGSSTNFVDGTFSKSINNTAAKAVRSVFIQVISNQYGCSVSVSETARGLVALSSIKNTGNAS
ncbi:hypothetical protein T06_15866 [Trichinella sp. T6]|nr:hypothetical protein T06_15866 [Trichinella sp. T6]